MHQLPENENFFKSYSDTKKSYSFSNTINLVTIYKQQFNPDIINQTNLSGCSIFLKHHNYQINIHSELCEYDESNSWENNIQFCYHIYLIDNKTNMNKIIHFAHYNEYKLINEYKNKLNGKDISVYEFLIVKRNKKMIEKFKKFLIDNVTFFLDNLYIFIEKKNYDAILINLNILQNFIELFINLVFFLKSGNKFEKEQKEILQNSIIKKLEMFIKDNEFSYICNIFFFHNFIEKLGLNEKIKEKNMEIDDFLIIKILEKKIKDQNYNLLSKSENKFYNNLYKLILRLQKKSDLVRELEINEIFLKITETHTQQKKLMKSVKHIYSIASKGDLNELLKRIIIFQNRFCEEQNTHVELLKLYLHVITRFSFSKISSIDLLRKIEELTNYSLKYILFIIKFKGSIYNFLYELSLINCSQNYTTEALLITLIINKYLGDEIKELESNNETTSEIFNNKMNILKKSKFLLNNVVNHFSLEIEKKIIEKLKKFPYLNIFKDEFIENIRNAKNTLNDNCQIEVLNKIIDKNIEVNKTSLLEHFKYNVYISMIKSIPSISNNYLLISNDIILTNDPYAKKIILELQDTKLDDIYTKLEKYNNIPSNVKNYLTCGLSSDLIQKISKILKGENKSEIDRTDITNNLKKIKNKFPCEEDYIYFLNKKCIN